MTWWGRMKARYADLVEEFGKVAIATYLVLFFGTWASFWFAIRTGVDVSTAASGAGTVGGAYLATKVTQPVRIAATLVLTPVVVKVIHRVRGTEPEPAESVDSS